MVFEVFRSLNSKADHLVNWDLVSLIHGGMDANQVLFLNHLVSDLRFQITQADSIIKFSSPSNVKPLLALFPLLMQFCYAASTCQGLRV